MRITWRRRILRLLPRLGLDVAAVAPGAVLVSRRVAVDLDRLGPGGVLVTHRRLGAKHWWELEKKTHSYLVHHHVGALLRKYRVNCVIDVGANRGQYGQRLRRAGYDGHIASFEPVPRTFAELRNAAADDPHWSVYPYALGREDGVVEMNVVPGTLSSLLAPTSFGSGRYAQLREPTTQEVPLRRLDGLLDEVLAPVAQPRPYLKLDTQGYDLEAFGGLGDRTADFVGIQSEVALMQIYEGMPRMPEAIAIYEAAGFEITGLYPVSRQTRTARVLEFDCVMVRPAEL
ncbi:MAG: FkbM family methyltransferase [Actinomycetota bacterium]|nr:FkbM family methyltransferase [Actinomycetota bacterium]